MLLQWDAGLYFKSQTLKISKYPRKLYISLLKNYFFLLLFSTFPFVYWAVSLLPLLLPWIMCCVGYCPAKCPGDDRSAFLLLQLRQRWRCAMKVCCALPGTSVLFTSSAGFKSLALNARWSMCIDGMSAEQKSARSVLALPRAVVSAKLPFWMHYLRTVQHN